LGKFGAKIGILSILSEICGWKSVGNFQCLLENCNFIAYFLTYDVTVYMSGSSVCACVCLCVFSWMLWWSAYLRGCLAPVKFSCL